MGANGLFLGDAEPFQVGSPAQVQRGMTPEARQDRRRDLVLGPREDDVAGA